MPELVNMVSKLFDAAERGEMALLQQCLAAGVPIDTPDPRKSPGGVPTKLTPLTPTLGDWSHCTVS